MNNEERCNNLVKEYSKETVDKAWRKVEVEVNTHFAEDMFINLTVAGIKHPTYATGKYEALGVVNSEIAEFLKAIERGTDEEAVAEAKDAIVTLQRFVLGHHLPEDQHGFEWEKRISK